MTRQQPPLHGRLAEIFQALDRQGHDQAQEALMEHLVGGTPARQIAEILTSEGYPISKTTINEWRKRHAAPSV